MNRSNCFACIPRLLSGENFATGTQNIHTRTNNKKFPAILSFKTKSNHHYLPELYSKKVDHTRCKNWQASRGHVGS